MSLKFGTGGIRAIMGEHGFNIGTIEKATHALVRVILSENAPKSCGIAYDTRHNSFEFAKKAAEILIQCGIETYLFDQPTPTPTLSYIIRQKKLGWGINITASHNPREYNGYKVYDFRGVQLMPDMTEKITNAMGTNIIDIDNNCGHLEQCLKILPKVNNPDFPFLYSALYGAGGKLVPQLFQKQGFTNVTTIHCNPDSGFGGMVRPNPEEDEVYDIEAAKKCGAKIIIATDPDCDRVGVMVLHNGDYIRMSGNQIAAVMFDEQIQNNKNKALITTQVSGRLCQAMAKQNNIKVIADLPTGFKYIGDMAEKRGGLLFGYEESCGYLFGDGARDKDGLLAAGMIAVIAANLWEQGKTIYDRWIELCEKYGYFDERLINIPLDEGVNIDEIKEKMEKLQLSENSWLVVRPSGTEPKVKIYYGVKQDSSQNSQKELKTIQDMLVF